MDEKQNGAGRDRSLTVAILLEAGFQEVKCWGASEHRIDPPKDLPAKRGVYAFALEDEVVYVGLASRSLKQRLNFYARPGASQRTNVRLNGMISELLRQGETVRILLAHPDDSEWSGLRLSGPEGLEAALIEDFDLPWNMRGSKRAPAPTLTRKRDGSNGRRARGSVSEAILAYVQGNPNCTELEIAKGVFGPDAVQPRANPYCRKLVGQGKLARLPNRPATYVWIGT